MFFAIDLAVNLSGLEGLRKQIDAPLEEKFSLGEMRLISLEMVELLDS